MTKLKAVLAMTCASWLLTPSGLGAQPKPSLWSASELQAHIQSLVAKTKRQMVFIPGGSFWLGDWGILMPSDENGKLDEFAPKGPKIKPGGDQYLPLTYRTDDKPPVWVRLDSFYLQSHKVTYGDFDVYVAANGLPPHPPETLDDSDADGWAANFYKFWRKNRYSDDVPAGVTWSQAKGYCQWLGKVTGLAFDLASEAQWEFAASNRVNSYHRPFPTPTGLLDDEKANPTWDQYKNIPKGSLFEVGKFQPSPNGFYDLLWNGLDWVNDWYAPNAYALAKVNPHNPKGPKSGTERVARGGKLGEMELGYAYLYRYHQEPDDIEVAKRELRFYGFNIRCAIQQSGALQWP